MSSESEIVRERVLRFSRSAIFRARATFKDFGTKEAKVCFHMLSDTAEECAKPKPFVEGKNEEIFDRLEKLWAGMDTVR